MTANTRKIKERNHYFDSLKYWLFVFVVLIHNPLPENLWGGIWTAIARCAVPTYFAISGYFSKRAEKKHFEKGLKFLRIFFVMNLIWFVIYTLISYSPYSELARWAKLEVNPKNILKCILFGSAFGNEYLWYLHAIGMIYIIVYFTDRFQLNEIIQRYFPFLVLLYWIMSEGTLLAFGKEVQPFLYRNWLIEGIGFFYMGKWIRGQECHRKFLYIMLLVVGSVVTIIEYSIWGRVEFYFGNLLMVYGMLALGKVMHLKDSILSKIGSNHSLHLYLYSPFVACVFSILQMLFFQTTGHQEVITVLVICGTTWIVVQEWFIKIIDKLKMA
jgi:fucose 4-O-acetylase-like acetyltransferase